MKLLLVSLAPLPVVAAFMLGRFSPGAPAATVSAERAGARAAHRALGDRADATVAIEELAGYVADDHFAGPATPDTGGDPVPPSFDESAPVPQAAPPPPEPPPPPPPPPDVGVVFRRQVSAVVIDPNGRLAVLLMDGGRATRRLQVGDRFEGSWTLISLTREAAVLSDGGRMRRVPFFGGPVTEEGASRG
ncbi:MAG: hypothetical protein V4466_05480 [Pseudomonadota bacterium]